MADFNLFSGMMPDLAGLGAKTLKYGVVPGLAVTALMAFIGQSTLEDEVNDSWKMFKFTWIACIIPLIIGIMFGSYTLTKYAKSA